MLTPCLPAALLFSYGRILRLVPLQGWSLSVQNILLEWLGDVVINYHLVLYPLDARKKKNQKTLWTAHASRALNVFIPLDTLIPLSESLFKIIFWVKVASCKKDDFFLQCWNHSKWLKLVYYSMCYYRNIEKIISKMILTLMFLNEFWNRKEWAPW